MSESGTKIPKTTTQHLYGVIAGIGMGNLVYESISNIGNTGLNYLQKSFLNASDVYFLGDGASYAVTGTAIGLGVITFNTCRKATTIGLAHMDAEGQRGETELEQIKRTFD